MTTTHSVQQHARFRFSWRSWAATAAGAWSLFYALLGVFWWAGGAGYPFGRNDENGSGSVLANVDAGAGSPVIVFVGLTCVALAWAMDRGVGRGARRWAVIAAGWAVVLFPVLIVMDGRSLELLPPLGLFGWVRIEDWPTLNLLVIAAGIALWIAATVAYTRRTRAWDDESVRREARVAAGWVRAGRVAAYGAALCPLPYIVIRTSWAIGRPIGAPSSFVETLSRNQPGVSLMELVLVSFALTGAVLTIGLYRRWGRVFPGWLPLIGGRQVPLWFPVTFGISATLAIFPWGWGMARPLLGFEGPGVDEIQTWGFDPNRPEFWGLGGLGWLFVFWALAIVVAVMGYYYRYRPAPNAATGSLAAGGHPKMSSGVRAQEFVAERPGAATYGQPDTST